jgi:3-oxoadipate enol-lactonase
VTSFEQGTGVPLILIPGIQGRWEWMRPAVAALAAHFRVITFSLLGEHGAGPSPKRFDAHLGQLDAALDDRRLDAAIVCGVSFGGLVALRYAAVRPGRVRRLVLVSTPSPSWRPDARVRRYANAPRASALPFIAGAPGRLVREIAAAIPDRAGRLAASVGYLRSILTHPGSPARMADRVRCLAGRDFVADARRITAPTLVVTGEPALDRVVPVAGTLEYLDLIPGAVAARLERTGHIGVVTRPEAFAELIVRWAD